MIELKVSKFKRKRLKESLQISHIKEKNHMIGNQEMYSKKPIPKGSRINFNTWVLIRSMKGAYLSEIKFNPSSEWIHVL